MIRIAVLACGSAVLGILAWAYGGTADAPAAPLVAPNPAPPAADAPAPGQRVPDEGPGPVGDLAGLPADLVAALSDPGAAAPMPKPRPGDWLSCQQEDGQTFEEFRTCRRRPVTEERRTIRILPLDDLARSGAPDAGGLVEYVSAYFGLPAKANSAAKPPKFTTRTNERVGVEQTLTGDVLDWLRGEVPSDGYCVIALTTRDLYPDPAWNYLFGQASLVDRVGVFSFARMDPAFPSPPAEAATRAAKDRVLVLRRCWRVVTHEIGHMFGVEHCIHHACLMNGCNSVSEMDRTPMHLCPVCLRKFQHAAGFDVLERYRRLSALYDRAGLAAESSWAKARAAHVAATTPARPPQPAPR